ncbi:hypothetical protein BDF22DRAFT_696036 [Syncephalis plumigaleata]|nr:hypothetical protein BDF22DRAFT_696036 [Syncephalis plumigaleata]
MGPTVNMKYLEDYLDIQRNFSLIRELDATSQRIVKSMESEVRVRELEPERRNDWLRQLLTSFETTVKHGEEKLALATQTYDMPRIPGTMAATSMTGGGNIRKRARKENIAGGSGARQNYRSVDESFQCRRRYTETTRSGGRGGASGTSSSGQRGAAIAAVAIELINCKSESSDMPIDPNEPTYCFCQQVSFGEMCDIEWFHFECVGLKQLPKGEWFCPNCRKGKK